nr:alpha-L-fucosidase [uncultured Acetatifactor sp.]
MGKNLIELQKDFVNLRFGMFIHFNSATFQFHSNPDVVDWEFDHENQGVPRRFPFDPQSWNPVRLDCAQWAEAGKAAGVEFAALTAKHHEGFCLWPTKYTEHCVRNSPVKTDVVREYLEAFRVQGMKAGLYFSILDLTQGINRRGCSPENKEYIKGQVTELLTGYGEIPFLIVDGWQSPWGGPSYEDLSFEEFDGWVKGLQPECLVLNIGSLDGLRHSDIVFHECAAGQRFEGGFAGPGASCHVLTKSWFWRDGDGDKVLKPADWAIDWIKRSNSCNTSFIINGSPNTDGLLDDNIVERFRQIGERYRKPAPLEEIPEGWAVR